MVWANVGTGGMGKSVSSVPERVEMAYFSNMTEWECWAADNCFRCGHWPKDDDAPACPVEMAHTLYSYDLCNNDSDPGKVILDMLIPPNATGLGNQRCAMFTAKNGVTDRHLRDWEKYKAAMAEAASADTRRMAETGTGSGRSPSGAVGASRDAQPSPSFSDKPHE